MSVQISVVLEKVSKRVQLPGGGQSLSVFINELDKAAKAERVTPLLDFGASVDQQLEWAAASLDPVEDEDALTEKEQEARSDAMWKAIPRTGTFYDPADGIKTVDALVAHLKKKDPDTLDAVKGELAELKKVLKKAAKEKRRFRLNVSA